MAFTLPVYSAPDFTQRQFVDAPNVAVALCEQDGVAPAHYHGTSMYPEYFKLDGQWVLAEESRMDAVVVQQPGGRLAVLEMRRLKAGDRVLLGRSEHAEEGIYLHTDGFVQQASKKDQFLFRQGRSRETAFSIDYDHLYELLRYEQTHGNVLWVLGPAFAFDYDARNAMQRLVEGGFVHGMLAGNALATHDLEGAYRSTALGQDIYTQAPHANGHYHHLDTINQVRKCGSIAAFIQEEDIREGIMYAMETKRIPYVLTSSIRDDGPLPEVIHSAYDGQARMRELVRQATTVICLATQLHTIATGNMTPSFRVVEGVVRPLYLYCVDISEFATNKLSDRGSLSARTIVTNVQDFIVNVAKGVGCL